MGNNSRKTLLAGLLLVLGGAAACRAPGPAGLPAAVVAPPGAVAVVLDDAIASGDAIDAGEPGAEPRAAHAASRPGDGPPAARRPEPAGHREDQRLGQLELAAHLPGSALERTLGGIDWTSVAKMNLGTPSMMTLGGGWGMSLSSGMDRLEECEPTLDLLRHGPGFTDTFVFLAAHFQLSRSAHLVGSVAGIRAQDEALSAVVDGGEVSAFTLGIHMQF